MGIKASIDITPSQRKIIVSLLTRNIPGITVWAFGSRVKWASRPDSDLDLVVFSTPEQQGRISAIKEAFEESSLPFRVDLLVWDEIPDNFKPNILANHVVLLEAPKERIGMSAGWPMIPLGELTVNLDAQRKPVKEADRKPGPYPYYGASGIVDYVEGYLFEGDHLLIAEDGENLRTRQLPIAFMAKGKFWVNNHAHIVVGNEKADTRFLMYALQCTDVSGFLTGAVMPKLTQGNLNRIPLPCPPIDIQRDIVRILGSLDDKIELNRQINQTLEQIAQTIFKSWFVDFEPVKAKIEAKAAGRDPERAAMCAISGKSEAELGLFSPQQFHQLAATAALFPDELVESELGMIPKGWEVKSLGCITSYLNRGISPKYTEDRGVLVLNQKCIRDNVVDISKARRHDVGQRKIDGRELTVGDVLINSTGVGTLGRVAQVLDLSESTIVDSHVTVVRAKCPTTWNYLGIELLRRQVEIEQLGEGSTGQTELNRGKLAGLMLTVPSLAVLQAFDTSTVTFRQQLAANLRQADTLVTLRDILLPKLLSGELVSNIDDSVMVEQGQVI